MSERVTDAHGQRLRERGHEPVRGIGMPSKNTIIGVSLMVLGLALGGGALWMGTGGEEHGVGEALAMAQDQALESHDRVAWTPGDPLEMTVYMSPTCGCCGEWVSHLEEHDFQVEVREREDMSTVKESFGVPRPLASCHTGLVNGYLVEGHVPANDIKSFLAEAPEGARGLTVPAMPVGSPGMEMGDRVDPYDVLVMMEDGGTRVYTSHGPS